VFAVPFGNGRLELFDQWELVEIGEVPVTSSIV
jgi:hypothetical protein